MQRSKLSFIFYMISQTMLPTIIRIALIGLFESIVNIFTFFFRTIDFKENKETGIRFALITGGNKGIGKEVVKLLLEKGYYVHILARDFKNIDNDFTLHRNRLTYSIFDLADFKNIHKNSLLLISDFKREHGKDIKIDLLINNAGVYKREYQIVDGFEYNLAVNFVGHFIFTNIMKKYINRIVNVSSCAAFSVQNAFYINEPISSTPKNQNKITNPLQYKNELNTDNDLNTKYDSLEQKAMVRPPRSDSSKFNLKTDDDFLNSKISFKYLECDFLMKKYAMSKLANILHTIYLNEVDKISSVCVHPGMIPSGLFDGTKYGIIVKILRKFSPILLFTEKEGALTILNAAFQAENTSVIFHMRGMGGYIPDYATLRASLNLVEHTMDLLKFNKISFSE